MATPITGWPEIAENQQDKEVTHNEALRLIEAISYRVLSRSNGGPPSSPADGDSYIVDSATGDWSNFNVDDVAAFINGGWLATPPFEGLGPLWVNDEGVRVNYTGSSWDSDLSGGVDVEDSGSIVIQEATNINFDANLTVTDDGDGTVSVSGSSAGVDAEDDGSIVVSGSTAFNFGTGLNVTDDSDGTVTVNGSFTTAAIADDGTVALSSPTEINARNNLTVTDDGDGTLTLDASSGGTTAEDDGTTIVAGATAINFRNSLDVVDDGDGTVSVDASSSGTTIEDDGSSVVTGATAVNFSSNLSVTDDGDGTVTVDASSSGVSGPASSTDNAIARYDGTGGDTLQNSGIVVDDDDNLSGHGQTYQTKAADFTLSSSEAGTTQECASGSAFTVTVPANSNVSLPVGYTVTFIQGDGNAITFSPQSGVTINSKNGNTSTNGQWSAATIVKKATDTWVLIGDLA